MLRLTTRLSKVSRTAVSITANRCNFLGSVGSSPWLNSGPRASFSWTRRSGKSDFSRAGSILDVGFTDSARERIVSRNCANEATALMPSLSETAEGILSSPYGGVRNLWFGFLHGIWFWNSSRSRVDGYLWFFGRVEVGKSSTKMGWKVAAEQYDRVSIIRNNCKRCKAQDPSTLRSPPVKWSVREATRGGVCGGSLWRNLQGCQLQRSISE